MVWIWILLLLSPTKQSNGNSDADALLAIKMQLSESTLPDSFLSSWVGTNPCKSSWEGLMCTNERVTTLNLTERGLSGKLPNELGNLTALEILDMSNNNITGPVPESFSALLKLRALNLSGNPIRGEFPPPILKIIGLVDIRMGACNLTGPLPDGILDFAALQNLYLFKNNITGPILGKLTTLSTLVELSLRETPLDSELPTNVAKWTGLKILSLHDCTVQGQLPTEWGGSLTSLEFMNLKDNNISGTIPSEWQQLKQLTTLMLDGNQLREHVPTWLPNLLNASNITLTCNYFSGPRPMVYPRKNVKGNCFDEDQEDGFRDHNRQCHSAVGCTEFFKSYPRNPPPPPSLPPSSPTIPAVPPSQTKSSHNALYGGVAGGVIFLIGLAATGFWICKCRKSSPDFEEESGSDMTQPLGAWQVPSGVEVFSLEQISTATKSFSKECEIGHGGFGKVYRGKLDDGRIVAVKQATRESKQGLEEFRNEVMLLSRLHHRHLVGLIGFCQTRKTQILVYEYMEHGNLHHQLLGKHLDWYQRLEIALAVAQGLDYLHSFADPPVIHRDLKPSNILLDANFVAKISDFGISRVSPEFDTHVSTRPAGTAGYLDPEYFMRRQLTTASDVYSFGVVLLELVTGQKAIDHKRTDEFNLVEWVKLKLKSGGISSVIDNRIAEDFPEETYLLLADTALKCANYEKTERPSIKVVLNLLAKLLDGVAPVSVIQSGLIVEGWYSEETKTTQSFGLDSSFTSGSYSIS